MAKIPSDPARDAFIACRSYFLTAAVFSFAINLLYLAAPLYMLQVYDRVISSGSMVTLLMLTIAIVLAFGALAGLETVRSRVLARASIKIDRLLGGKVVMAMIERSAMLGGARSQVLRDFDTVRQFVSGSGINAIFDLPWAPLYIIVIFLLNVWLGAFALVSALVLIGVMLLNERLVRPPMDEFNASANRNYSFTEMSLRNAEVVQAMGMGSGLLNVWSRERNRMIDRHALATDRSAAMSSTIKFLRLSVQSLILGLGALVVIERMTTVGSIFAASLLLGRALQPVEQIVGGWRGLISARDAYSRVRALLSAAPSHDSKVKLPRPAGRLSVEAVSYIPPRAGKPVLQNVSFRAEPGEVIGIIGPSGAGKSTLIRHIVGVLKPSAGVVRLDGADVSTWPKSHLGQHIGYLPQDIELFSDTVAANIGRFGQGNDRSIVKAAQLANMHEMILRLPDGYETEVGEGGATLSGGYRQRIALARAVYADPSLVILDEPSSNLDAEGDAALGDCIMELKKANITVIVVSHRPATIAAVDKILLLIDGTVQAFGPKADVLSRLGPHPASPTNPNPLPVSPDLRRSA